MIRRFYVHNFRCLENFELPLIEGQESILLIGKNGAGKTTILKALQVLQRIARGTNRVGQLVRAVDLPHQRQDAPMRFELEVQIEGHVFDYRIAFELPESFREMRVLEERLSFNQSLVYAREYAQVELARNNRGQTEPAAFRIDWHLAALPIVQEQSNQDPLSIFKRWLSRVLILRPNPTVFQGTSDSETLEPDPDGSNLGNWLAGLLAFAPKSYSKIESYLTTVMPDFQEIRNPIVGKETRSLEVLFAKDRAVTAISLDDLSDGEKCFLLSAVVLAANDAYGPLLCFWDEPDNYLSLDEVGHFVTSLRKGFRQGQLICTSHNPEAIRGFSDDNTLVLHRNSHLEPTQARRLRDLERAGDLIDSLIRGDVRL